MENTTPPKKYRGPPPRKDLVQSPCRERDWKGNDVFGTTNTNNNNDTNMSDERQQIIRPQSASGIMPGMNDEYVDPHMKASRDYESHYAKLAMQGGHKDLLAMNGNGVPDEDSQRKSKRADNLSDYNKMAKQGGHKDLLSTNGDHVDGDTQRRQKTCEDVSEYNRVALQGGRKGLLSMEGEQQEMDQSMRKQKGCDNISDYNKMALQGGHKDLLVIEENKRPAARVEYARKGGDWFAHEQPQKNTYAKPNGIDERHNLPAAGRSNRNNQNGNVTNSPRTQGSNGNNSSCILPGGQEHGPRVGKKRFDQSAQKRDAPFATFF